VPTHKLETACIVLPFVFGNFRFSCLVFVDWDRGPIDGCDKGNIFLAARDVIDNIGGEAKVAQ
jgi:hypothetical protein